MPDLLTPTHTLAILRQHDFSIRKKYGQNFLVDRHILDKILAAAAIDSGDLVIEIGPGIGTMTRHLAARAENVVAVEIDRQLIPILRETLADYANVAVIHGDIMKMSLTELVSGGAPIKVVANLPYYITTPLIMALLEAPLPIDSITVMVQKEVAARMRGGPGTKDYGALSLAVQYHARMEIIAAVPPSCFIPQPKVESAVIHLTKHPAPPVAVTDEALLFALIRAAFNQRRKTLANALANAESLAAVTREAVARALRGMGLDEAIRGEALTLAQFAGLANILKEPGA